MPYMTNQALPLRDRWSHLKTWIAERRAKIKDSAVNIRRAFGMVWASHPLSALAMAGCTLVGAFLPAGQAWLGKLIVDRVVTCATARGFTHTIAELELIERWLAAHLYTKNDPILQSKSTQGASGQFVQGEDPPERYKAGALMVDSSGCLKTILAGNRAKAVWLGKKKSAQIDYVDRD